MHLSQKPVAQRECLEAIEPYFQGAYVIQDLTKVRILGKKPELRLCRKDFTQRGLRAFDPRTRHGLTPDIGLNEQVRIRQQPTETYKSPHLPRTRSGVSSSSRGVGFGSNV